MKVLKIILIGLGVLIGAVLLIAAFLPTDYSVERTTTINAPAEIVFPHVQYLRKTTEWSPWNERDQQIKFTVDGTDGQVGAVYNWEGDPKLSGRGTMTITDIKVPSLVKHELKFLEPMEDTGTAYTELTEANGATTVAWRFEGKIPYPFNIMTLVMNMDDMLGNDLERGLELLKNLTEKEFKQIQSYKIQQKPFLKTRYAYVRGSVKMNDIAAFYGKNYNIIGTAAKMKRSKIMGMPCGLYYTWDEGSLVADMAAAIPVKRSFETEEVKTLTIPSSKSLVVDYFGPYEKIGPAHMAIDYFMKQNKLKMQLPVIEQYLNDPTKVSDPSEIHTRIIYLLVD